MFISKKMSKYFEENKDKNKEEIIKELIEVFGYKESTAITYYSNRKVNVMNRHKIAFDFFKANPSVLSEMDNKIHSKELGISINTYATYKSEYRAEIQKENLKLIQVKRKNDEAEKAKSYGEKYYKNRLRQKFNIDDSKLFG